MIDVWLQDIKSKSQLEEVERGDMVALDEMVCSEVEEEGSGAEEEGSGGEESISSEGGKWYEYLYRIT